MEEEQKPNVENTDKDTTCRLRNGLNVYTLTKIFQYLSSSDLWTLGEMNVFYKQIITDHVIAKHIVNFDLLYSKNITDRQFFANYGKKLGMFKISCKNDESFHQFIQLITEYCSHDQLKLAGFRMNQGERAGNGNRDEINLPVHLQRVESFYFAGSSNFTPTLNISFSDALQNLTLRSVCLNANFRWIEMVNLNELVLDFVNGFNDEHFIEFLRRGTKLEYFHQVFTLINSSSGTREAIGKYCGPQIKTLVDSCMLAIPDSVYEYLRHFTNLKNVTLSSQEQCIEDLKYPLQILAENDSIEKLGITCTTSPAFAPYVFESQEEFMYDHNQSDIKPFTKLKTISFFWINCGYYVQMGGCDELKLLTTYSTQFLSNVENLIFKGSGATALYNTEFIKYVPKIRWIYIEHWTQPSLNQAVKLIEHLKKIVLKRNNGCISEDFIEVEVRERDLQVYNGIQDIGESVRFNLLRTNIEKRELV